jgi:putative hemolysin
MVARSDAQIVPVYFCGHNSRVFQLASHLHYTLRMGLLIKEFKARTNKPVDLVIGEPIPQSALQPYIHDARAMMDFLRRETYGLSPEPMSDPGYGFEFEDRYRQ